MNIYSPISEIKGIGKKTEEYYNSLGIYTVLDLLEYYPRDYEHFDKPDIISLGKFNEINTVYAKLTGIPKLHQANGKKVVSAIWVDVMGNRFSSVWFNQPYLCKSLHTGDSYVLRGKKIYRGGVFELVQPQLYTKSKYDPLVKTLIPIYALTSGITRQAIIKNIKLAFENIYEKIQSPLDGTDYVRGFMDYNTACHQIHFPTDEKSAKDARERIVLEEFYRFLSRIQAYKKDRALKRPAYILEEKRETERYLSELPFSLTQGQEKAFNEIRKDLTSDVSMHRIVQGDVGSGKTVLAFLTMAEVSLNNCQSVLMAPTAVLARQHFDNFKRLFPDMISRTVLLTGDLKLSEKNEIYNRIITEDNIIVIGTHAVFQEKVLFKRLMLVITDEQHRFGVEQRHILADKGENPHVLYMSATPIPRTLAGILYADMDITILSEKPKGRTKIHTCVIGQKDRNKAYSFIKKELDKGHQVYAICPLVEESELLSGENVIDYAKSLSEIFKANTCEILHGRMKQSEKDAVMNSFSQHRIDILVSTTVIEVGVDVPNASVIVIENADRFGLAQLHQLRGRVGRGNTESYCILINSSEEKEDNERLQIMNESDDGFEISSKDFKMRGPGDILGVRQSGTPEFKLADIYGDAKILELAQKIIIG